MGVWGQGELLKILGYCTYLTGINPPDMGVLLPLVVLRSSTRGLNILGIKLRSDSRSTTVVWAILKASTTLLSPSLSINGNCGVKYKQS